MARIAIIHHSGIIGGAGISLLNVVNILADKHEITVFVSDSPRDILESLNNIADSKGIRVVSYGKRIGALTYYSGGDKANSLRFLYRASLIFKQWHYWNKTISGFNPDIVIVNSLILSWMSLLPAMNSRKSICFVRETMANKPESLINKFFKRCLNQFDCVSFISEFDKLSWQLHKTKSVVIHNCFATDKMNNENSYIKASNELGLRAKSFHILYVGGVSYMKGFDLAVNATIELNKKCDAELIVAGIDFNGRRNLSNGKLSEYESELENRILSHGNSSKIHLIGRQKDMDNCFIAADVLVFPMRSPHQARPVFESGFYGIPVVITDFPNIREFVVDGSNGLVFEKDNVQQLTECLYKLALNPEYRNKLGMSNKRLSEQNHSISAFGLSINHLINSLL